MLHTITTIRIKKTSTEYFIYRRKTREEIRKFSYIEKINKCRVLE